MEEGFLDFLFGTARPIVFLLGEGLVFRTADTIYLRQNESIYFWNYEVFFTMLLGPINKFNYEFIKLVYIWSAFIKV